MSNKRKQRKSAYKPSMDDLERDTLHGLVIKCFEKAHDYASDFSINADEFRLLERLLNEIEAIKNEKYIDLNVGVVV